MSVKLEFVDTNILLYAHDPSEPDKHQAAKTLLERTGAVLTYRNGKSQGAVVTARWQRPDLEIC